jgi:DNA-directed RNA polymerase specialized sigma24 family protein
MLTNGQDAFHDKLVALLPRLRRNAPGLVRNRADAEDLLQAMTAFGRPVPR